LTDDFVDREAIQAVIGKAMELLRPIGLTIQPEMVQVTLAGSEMLVILPCLLRPEAKQKLEGDRESRAEFNKMMAERNEALIEEKKQEIADAAKNDLAEVLFGGATTCKHEHVHPEGFCIDCGKQVNG